MAIQINLDLMLVKRKMSLTELAQRVGLSLTALSLFKTGKLKGLRFGSLNAICRELDCQPGDIVQYIPDESPVDSNTE
ncbi:MAG: helix-turn-helix transcriptional regulator, partial [Candidatus Zixiibacteriota bacterium]